MSKAWAVFFLASANFFLSQFYRSTNAVIAPQLIKDYAWTRGPGTPFASFFTPLVGSNSITIFLDRIGARRMMTGFSLGSGAFVFSWASL
jgi:hypothetical protein